MIRLSEPRIHPQKESEWDDDARNLIEGLRRISEVPVSNLIQAMASFWESCIIQILTPTSRKRTFNSANWMALSGGIRMGSTRNNWKASWVK